MEKVVVSGMMSSWPGSETTPGLRKNNSEKKFLICYKIEKISLVNTRHYGHVMAETSPMERVTIRKEKIRNYLIVDSDIERNPGRIAANWLEIFIKKENEPLDLSLSRAAVALLLVPHVAPVLVVYARLFLL
ncbi:MAG: hypothetical protein P8Z41_15000 [Anaerolineales bacterium]